MAHTRTIEHYWQPNPDVASAVKGDTTVGDVRYVMVRDPVTSDLLRAVLVELRKLNIQLALQTGEEVKDTDIEGLDL